MLRVINGRPLSVTSGLGMRLKVTCGIRVVAHGRSHCPALWGNLCVGPTALAHRCPANLAEDGDMHYLCHSNKESNCSTGCRKSDGYAQQNILEITDILLFETFGSLIQQIPFGLIEIRKIVIFCEGLGEHRLGGSIS